MSKSAIVELLRLAKGFGNDLVSNKVVGTRGYERKNLMRQNAFSVKPQKKVRLDNKAIPSDEDEEGA